jgi:hypothetical protein
MQHATVKREKQVQRAKKLREDAAELCAQAEAAAVIYNEVAPQAERARNQMEHCARQASLNETLAGDIEHRLAHPDAASPGRQWMNQGGR